MDFKNMVARSGITPRMGLKILPLLVLALIWLWVVIVLFVVGLNTSVFHTAFGWIAMIPHGL